MTKYTIDNSIIERAKVTDPIPWLIASGFFVLTSSPGNNLYVYLNGFTKKGDEDIRITLKADGHWISCHHDNTPIGSNINLVLELNQQLYPVEAARLICEAAGVDTSPYFSNQRHSYKSNIESHFLSNDKTSWPPLPDKKPPILPVEAGIAEGIAYLKHRGISKQTIDFARESKFIKFIMDGVVFCGYDNNGALKCATKRSTDINITISDKKRDLSGSIKAYAPVLPGNSEVIWIVEGGVDALAIRDIAIRQGNNPPTVIVTGGRNTKTWTENPSLLQIITKSERCYICMEGDQGVEFNKTKTAIIAQQALIQEKTGKTITIWPSDNNWPKGCKDMADLNLYKINKMRKL